MPRIDFELSMKDRATVLSYCELITTEKDFKKKNEYVDKMMELIASKAVEEYKRSVTNY